MIVTLDGERVNRTFAPDSTLQGVLDQVRPDLRAGRLFVAVAIDGRECTQAQLEELLPKPVDVNSQVDLESGDRQGNPNHVEPERQAALMARAPILQPAWILARHDCGS